MKKRLLSLFVALVLIFSVQLKAQSLEETLSGLSKTAGKAYVAPVVSAFGSNLNSGWVSRVPEATLLGFYLDLKIVAMGSFFSSDVKKFTASDKFTFNDSQIDEILQRSGLKTSNPAYNSIKNEMRQTPFDVTFSGPTIIGSKKDTLRINFPGKNIQGYQVQPYNLVIKQVIGFLDELPAFPTATAQLTLGTVFGTNVSVRYFPEVNIQDLGKFSFRGFGAIHNPGIWFPNPLPLDIGVGYFYQQLKVGDIFDSKATQFGIYASKKFGGVIAIIPYAGLTVESSKTTVRYRGSQNINGVSVPLNIDFDLEGENTSSAVIGFNLHLAVVNINADYKFAKTKTASAGISFGF